MFRFFVYKTVIFFVLQKMYLLYIAPPGPSLLEKLNRQKYFIIKLIIFYYKIWPRLTILKY